MKINKTFSEWLIIAVGAVLLRYALTYTTYLLMGNPRYANPLIVELVYLSMIFIPSLFISLFASRVFNINYKNLLYVALITGVLDILFCAVRLIIMYPIMINYWHQLLFNMIPLTLFSYLGFCMGKYLSSVFGKHNRKSEEI